MKRTALGAVLIGVSAASVFGVACSDTSFRGAAATRDQSRLEPGDDGYEAPDPSEDTPGPDENAVDGTSPGSPVPGSDPAGDGEGWGDGTRGAADAGVSVPTTGVDGGAPSPSDTITPTGPTDVSRPVDDAVTTPTGTIVPLYINPANGGWQPLIDQKLGHPNVPVVAAVNPGNGPGVAKDKNYTDGIDSLVAAGILPIGYVSTMRGMRPQEDVENDIKTWRAFYPAVKGIFFDEQDNQPGTVGYYTREGAYAKSMDFQLTVGNPGTMWVDAGYFNALDVIIVYETAGMPNPMEFEQKLSMVARSQCGIMPYSVGTLDPAQVITASKWVQYVYVSELGLPNPWKQLPSYLDSLFSTLDGQPASATTQFP